MLIVQKYGGSSLKDAERLRHVAGLVRDRRGESELEAPLFVIVEHLAVEAV